MRTSACQMLLPWVASYTPLVAVGHGFHLAAGQCRVPGRRFWAARHPPGAAGFRSGCGEVRRRADRKLNAAHILGQNALLARMALSHKLPDDRAAVDLVHQAGGQLQPQADLAFRHGGGSSILAFRIAVQRVAALYQRRCRAPGGRAAPLQVGFRDVDVLALSSMELRGQQVWFSLSSTSRRGWRLLLDQPVVTARPYRASMRAWAFSCAWRRHFSEIAAAGGRQKR